MGRSEYAAHDGLVTAATAAKAGWTKPAPVRARKPSLLVRFLRFLGVL